MTKARMAGLCTTRSLSRQYTTTIRELRQRRHHQSPFALRACAACGKNRPAHDRLIRQRAIAVVIDQHAITADWPLGIRAGRAEKPHIGRHIAIIVPHAAGRFSGPRRCVKTDRRPRRHGVHEVGEMQKKLRFTVKMPSRTIYVPLLLLLA